MRLVGKHHHYHFHTRLVQATKRTNLTMHNTEECVDFQYSTKSKHFFLTIDQRSFSSRFIRSQRVALLDPTLSLKSSLRNSGQWRLSPNWQIYWQTPFPRGAFLSCAKELSLFFEFDEGARERGYLILVSFTPEIWSRLGWDLRIQWIVWQFSFVQWLSLRSSQAIRSQVNLQTQNPHFVLWTSFVVSSFIRTCVLGFEWKLIQLQLSFCRIDGYQLWCKWAICLLHPLLTKSL